MKFIGEKQINVIENFDRTQRAHHVMHNGLRLGCVMSNRHSRTVCAVKDTVVSPVQSEAGKIKHGERKEICVPRGCSKMPAFTELERWVCE